MWTLTIYCCCIYHIYLHEFLPNYRNTISDIFKIGMELSTPSLLNRYITLDREIFAVKKFSPPHSTAKIKHAKYFQPRIIRTLKLARVVTAKSRAKSSRCLIFAAKISNVKIWMREIFPIYGTYSVYNLPLN